MLGRGKAGMYGNKETTQMRTNKSYLFWTHYSKGFGHHHSSLAETQRQRGVWEHCLGRKGEGFMYALAGGCWHREGGWGLARNRASYVIDFRSTFGFLILILSWKQGGKAKETGSHAQVLTVWGLLLRDWHLSSWAGYYQDCGLEFCCHICSGHCPFVYLSLRWHSEKTLEILWTCE